MVSDGLKPAVDSSANFVKPKKGILNAAGVNVTLGKDSWCNTDDKNLQNVCKATFGMPKDKDAPVNIQTNVMATPDKSVEVTRILNKDTGKIEYYNRKSGQADSGKTKTLTEAEIKSLKPVAATAVLTAGVALAKTEKPDAKEKNQVLDFFNNNPVGIFGKEIGKGALVVGAMAVTTAAVGGAAAIAASTAPVWALPLAAAAFTGGTLEALDQKYAQKKEHVNWGTVIGIGATSWLVPGGGGEVAAGLKAGIQALGKAAVKGGVVTGTTTLASNAWDKRQDILKGNLSTINYGEVAGATVTGGLFAGALHALAPLASRVANRLFRGKPAIAAEAAPRVSLSTPPASTGSTTSVTPDAPIVAPVTSGTLNGLPPTVPPVPAQPRLASPYASAPEPGITVPSASAPAGAIPTPGSPGALAPATPKAYQPSDLRNAMNGLGQESVTHSYPTRYTLPPEQGPRMRPYVKGASASARNESAEAIHIEQADTLIKGLAEQAERAQGLTRLASEGKTVNLTQLNAASPLEQIAETMMTNARRHPDPALAAQDIAKLKVNLRTVIESRWGSLDDNQRNLLGGSPGASVKQVTDRIDSRMADRLRSVLPKAEVDKLEALFPDPEVRRELYSRVQAALGHSNEIGAVEDFVKIMAQDNPALALVAAINRGRGMTGVSTNRFTSAETELLKTITSTMTPPQKLAAAKAIHFPGLAPNAVEGQLAKTMGITEAEAGQLLEGWIAPKTLQESFPIAQILDRAKTNGLVLPQGNNPTLADLPADLQQAVRQVRLLTGTSELGSTIALQQAAGKTPAQIAQNLLNLDPTELSAPAIAQRLKAAVDRGANVEELLPLIQRRAAELTPDQNIGKLMIDICNEFNALAPQSNPVATLFQRVGNALGVGAPTKLRDPQPGDLATLPAASRSLATDATTPTIDVQAVQLPDHLVTALKDRWGMDPATMVDKLKKVVPWNGLRQELSFATGWNNNRINQFANDLANDPELALEGLKKELQNILPAKNPLLFMVAPWIEAVYTN